MVTRGRPTRDRGWIKVLNGGDVRVSAETEERILAAAADLGYRPNTIARSLVQRATRWS